MAEFGSCWGLLAGSLLIAAPVVFLRVRDTVPLEDDLKFSDETVEDVLPTGTTAIGGETEVEVEGEQKMD